MVPPVSRRLTRDRHSSKAFDGRGLCGPGDSRHGGPEARQWNVRRASTLESWSATTTICFVSAKSIPTIAFSAGTNLRSRATSALWLRSPRARRGRPGSRHKRPTRLIARIIQRIAIRAPNGDGMSRLATSVKVLSSYWDGSTAPERILRTGRRVRHPAGKHAHGPYRSGEVHRDRRPGMSQQSPARPSCGTASPTALVRDGVGKYLVYASP